MDFLSWYNFRPQKTDRGRLRLCKWTEAQSFLLRNSATKPAKSAENVRSISLREQIAIRRMMRAKVQYLLTYLCPVIGVKWFLHSCTVWLNFLRNDQFTASWEYFNLFCAVRTTKYQIIGQRLDDYT